MKKVKRTALFAGLAVILCLIFFLIGRSSGGEGNTEMSAVVLENRLTEISELATITYSYTNMAEFENSRDFYGVKLPFTTKSFIITYDGEINAGVDLSKAEVSVRGTRVNITLPEAEILSHQIDEDSIEVFDETTSIFNPLKVEDYQAFNKDQKKKMEEKAESKGLLTEAKAKAISSITEMLSQILSDEYTLNIE
ncbi:MAG: DUF4230 domain-containing protein [Anaerovoracaceae bacterium]